MRVFALSDIHIDYEVNARWIKNLSTAEYQDDVLILAGDVTDTLRLLEWCLGTLRKRFKKVMFVPGNHELWVIREGREKNSLQKFDDVCAVVESSGASMQPFRDRGVSIIPLLTWYDYSFGEQSEELRAMWMDYRACRWPSGLTEKDVALFAAHRFDARVHSMLRQASISHSGLRTIGSPVAKAQRKHSRLRTQPCEPPGEDRRRVVHQQCVRLSARNPDNVEAPDVHP